MSASKSDNDDERPPPAEEIDAPTTRLAISISMIDLREMPAHGESGVDVTSDVLPEGFLPSVLPFVPVASPNASPNALAAPNVPNASPNAPNASPNAPNALQSIGAGVVVPRRSFDVPDVAKVAAQLAEGSRERVLSANGLTEQRWAEIERLCAERLAKEAESCKTALRDAYDEAFLEARARRRGPFGLDAIARLYAELETDSVGAVIDSALDISDAMRFKRLRAANLQSRK